MERSEHKLLPQFILVRDSGQGFQQEMKDS
jgi:hypothetical protein